MKTTTTAALPAGDPSSLASAPQTATAVAPQTAQSIAVAGSQHAVPGPEQFFTGRARIDPLYAANENVNASGAYVTFEPGARSAWHTHPKGQYLVVTAGVGLTQEWGKPARQIKPGDVVWCPPGIKHWHGAGLFTALTHLAVTPSDNGKNVEWMEKVSDTQYSEAQPVNGAAAGARMHGSSV
ncbi:MAG: cupin domain-containing protein [Burkholderiaceae bacterium]|nr:MAG: cupin domain-containing protein [Burkholderiaceae bacterium]TBR75446.1 MAG: cupin domain-containing protein [Burkholderiaceae bacterium]